MEGDSIWSSWKSLAFGVIFQYTGNMGNVPLFNDRRLVREEELEDVAPRFVYKADGGFYEQERDVAKRRNEGGSFFFGIKNQTRQEGICPCG